MNATFAVPLIALLLALPWQVRHLRKSEPLYEFAYSWDIEDPSQFTAPFYAGAITVAACLVYGVAAVSLGGLGAVESAADAAWLLGRSFVFWGLLFLTALFSPLMTAYLGSAMVMTYLSTGVLQAAPLVKHVLDWVFFEVSAAVQIAYCVTVTIYGLMMARGIPDLSPFTVEAT